MKCGHRFCVDCYRQYLTARIRLQPHYGFKIAEASSLIDSALSSKMAASSRALN
ncbi:uncharacterized protein BKA78DRAFT_327557 [Phyllosticta capitalensis]|uniref:uncharacterized protein n=1 Tax=Phyllosticta capitalensis TaxID=121624 RepID=UPI0031306D00